MLKESAGLCTIRFRGLQRHYHAAVSKWIRTLRVLHDMMEVIDC